MTANVISLAINAGIQKDGTEFDSSMYVDGKWVRFQRGRPRKIGGYKGIFLNAPSISRGMTMQSQEGLNYVYSGFNDSLQLWQTDNDDGVGSGPTDITLNNFTATSVDNCSLFFHVALWITPDAPSPSTLCMHRFSQGICGISALWSLWESVWKTGFPLTASQARRGRDKAQSGKVSSRFAASRSSASSRWSRRPT